MIISPQFHSEWDLSAILDLRNENSGIYIRIDPMYGILTFRIYLE